jgi:hypothetical protein
MESEACNHKYLEELEIGLCCLSCGALRNFVPKASDTAPTSNTESDEKYQYMLLRPDEIRLVELLPDSEDHPISCRIVTNQLQAAADYQYEAISYTWATEDGDASRSQSIQVYHEIGKDRKYLRVTRNCENALRQLRCHRSERNVPGAYMVWIDSVCINQERINERNQQVSMMDQIYKNAVRVNVCIHAQGQDYRGAMKLLDYYRMVDSQYSPNRESDLFKYTKAIEKYFPDKNQARHELHPSYIQLARLFSLRYFSRVWVVQEILLSQKAFLYVNSEVVPLKEQILRSICDTSISRSVSIPWLSQWVSVWNKAPGIILCLNMSLNCSASDTRDKVFAITGLLNPCTRAMIPIDYMSSVENVLATAVTACIAESGDLSILRYALLPKDTDMHTAQSLNMAQFKEYLERQASIAVSNPPGTRDRNDHALPLIAMKDRCKRCGPVRDSEAWNTTCALQCNDSSLVSTFEGLNLPIPATQILPRLRVQAYPIDKCTESTDQNLPDFLDELQIRENAHKLTLNPSLTHGLCAYDLEDFATDLWYARRGDMRELVEYIVFRTWHSVGFTLGHCLPGDIVAAIDGCTHPLILRGIGYRSFRIVGECFLWNEQNVACMNNRSVGAGTWGDHFGGRKQFIEIH